MTAILGSSRYSRGLYLHADGPLGSELYRADADGMTLVRDIHPTGSAMPRELTVVGDRLYFRADDGVLGEELWETDGTAAGTRPVADLATGSRGSRPNGLASLGGSLYFWADDGPWGASLWRLRAGTLELVETTALVEQIELDANLNDWPRRYDARTIHDPAGDVGPGNPIDLRSAKLGWTGSALLVGYQLAAPIGRQDVARIHAYFDVDRRRDTGMRVQGPLKTPFGADYMIEGITLYRHRTSSGAWDWEPIADAGWSDYSPVREIELRFYSSLAGTGILGSRVLLWGSNPTQDDYAELDGQ